MAVSDLLDPFRDRGMNVAIQRTIVNRTLEANNLEKLKGLIAKFEPAIQAHDAKVAAAQATLSAHELLAMESYGSCAWHFMHHFQHLHHFQRKCLLPVLPKATPTESKATPTRFRN
jgi:hypothetical protein